MHAHVSSLWLWFWDSEILHRQPYCRTCVADIPPFSKGEMLSVFFFLVFCAWLGVLCPFLAVLLFLGSLFGKIFGSELLFLGVGVGLAFFDSVLLRLLLYDLAVRPRNCLGKILLVSGLLFVGSFSLPLVVRRHRFIFFFFLLQEI